MIHDQSLLLFSKYLPFSYRLIECKGWPSISDNVIQTRLEKLLLHESNFLVFSVHPTENFSSLELKVLIFDGG